MSHPDPRTKLGVPAPRNPITGELKDLSDIEGLLKIETRLVHGLKLTRVDDALDSPPLLEAECKCGWKSERPRGEFLIRDEYKNHTDNLWEVA